MAQPTTASDPAPALRRGLKLLELLYRQGAMSLEQLAAESGWPKSSVLRLMQSLVAEAAAARDPQTLAYRALMRLTPIESTDRRLKQHCAASMAALGRLCGNTVELHRCDGAGLEMIDRQSPPDAIVLAIARVGWRREMAEIDALLQVACAFGPYALPAAMWCWGKGKRQKVPAARARRLVEQARENGAAVDCDINANGVRRYAAPIFDQHRKLIAVLAIAQACTIHATQVRPDFTDAVRRTAERLSSTAI